MLSFKFLADKEAYNETFSRLLTGQINNCRTVLVELRNLRTLVEEFERVGFLFPFQNAIKVIPKLNRTPVFKSDDLLSVLNFSFLNKYYRRVIRRSSIGCDRLQSHRLSASFSLCRQADLAIHMIILDSSLG